MFLVVLAFTTGGKGIDFHEFNSNVGNEQSILDDYEDHTGTDNEGLVVRHINLKLVYTLQILDL